MKLPKWLSLAMLVTFSGSYLAPSLALAQTNDGLLPSSEAPSQQTQESSKSQEDNDHNGIPDHEEDKNHNGVPDDEEDANKNGIPDDLDAKEEQSSSSSEASSSQETGTDQGQSQASSSAQSSPSSSTNEASSNAADDQSKTESSASPTSEEEAKAHSSGSKENDIPAKEEPKTNLGKNSAESKKQVILNSFQVDLKLPSNSASNTRQTSQADRWFGPVDNTPTTPPSYTAYVEHWSGDSAYTHNLLSHRYGITAEQLDGYLNSLGVSYNHNRINGKLLLQWQNDSGLDVRAIIAIAMAESSLGTAGVATIQGSNMFGYGAFDANPDNAANFSDDKAITKMTAETIIQNKNWTFKIQDDKAKKNAMGQLNPIADGGVYFTDTSGTGKRRAQIMQDIDTWIDQHGGTPPIPEDLKHLNGTSAMAVPSGYQISHPMSTDSYIAASYPWGQCTWYVYNRAKELGYSYDAYMGNGGDWQHKAGYDVGHTPKVGYAVSFAPGQAGADPSYGHVAIVEEVKADGSILISESNALGLGVVSYRTFSAAQASTLTYVIGHKS
ncbi:CHAP domain-containing protein [Streptococcus dentasini]